MDICIYSVNFINYFHSRFHYYHYQGVFSDVLNYVLRISCSKHNALKVTSADTEEDVKLQESVTMIQQKALQGGDSNISVETVCVECFNFLKALAKDYFEIKMR